MAWSVAAQVTLEDWLYQSRDLEPFPAVLIAFQWLASYFSLSLVASEMPGIQNAMPGELSRLDTFDDKAVEKLAFE